jgi:hypothetical protein
MSISLSLPLSDLSLESPSYYFDIDQISTVFEEDLDPEFRIMGYATATGNLLPRQYIFVMNMPIPIRQNSLNSATLKFSMINSFPINIGFTEIDPSDPLFVEGEPTSVPFEVRDPRQIELDRSQTNNFSIDIKTPRSTGLINSFSNSIRVDPAIIQTFNVNNNQQNSLNITQFLSLHINNINRIWKINSNVPLILSGVPANIPGVGAIDLNSLTLDLNYKIVPPEAPLIISVIESDYKQVSIEFTEPDGGGENISRYLVEYAQVPELGEDLSWIKAEETIATNITINNLITEKLYIFRVAAINSAGIGPFSNSSQPIKISQNKRPITSLSFNDANPTRIRVRRAASAEWNQFNPILAIGEIAYEIDTNRLKVGDGVSVWLDLPYTKIDQNSINFPAPPDIFFYVASSEFNLPSNDRIILNLSENNRLNFIGKEGINISYDNSYRSLTFRNDKLYNPISSGTIFNPSSSGTPGSLFYDNTWLYFCTDINYWQRTPIDKSWINFSEMVINGANNLFEGSSSLIFDQNFAAFFTNNDPYPSLAGNPLTNTSVRNFFNLPTIIPGNKTLNFIYRGGLNSHNPMVINNNEIAGFFFNGIAIKSFSLGSDKIGNFVPAPLGFTFNFDFQNKSKVSSDNCGGFPDLFGYYTYRDGSFLKNCWNIPEVYLTNSYYNSSQYNNDYFRHNDGHSKILGFCLDGYPIYGPYGYDDPNDQDNVVLIRSSYSGLVDDSHRPLNWKYEDLISTNNETYTLLRGMFIEDFVYIQNYGHLDEFNGRFCVTPEFPQGTYAYFLTFTNETLTIPEFPYIFGFSTKEQRLSNV